MKFSSNFRLNSASMNPHKLTPRANMAVRGENEHFCQAAGPVSPVAAAGLSEAEGECKSEVQPWQQAQRLTLADRAQFPM